MHVRGERGKDFQWRHYVCQAKIHASGDGEDCGRPTEADDRERNGEHERKRKRAKPGIEKKKQNRKN